MKLIRLTTERSDALFDNNFNEDFIIEPNSQICLQAFTTQLNKDVLVIDNQNNIVEFTLNGVSSGRGYHTIALNTGNYDSSDMNDFFTDFTSKLNGEMHTGYASEVGKQWQVALKGNRVEILCERGDVLTFDYGQIAEKYLKFQNSEIFQMSIFQNYLQRTTGTPGTYDAYCYSNQPANKGASILTCQFAGNSTTNHGFILGYLTQIPTNGSVISLNNIKYGIIYTDNDNPYSVIINGVILPVEQLAQSIMPNIVGPYDENNDVINITIESNKYINFSIYRNNSPEPFMLLYSLNIVGGIVNELYSIEIMVGEDDIWNFQNTTDPFYRIDDKSIYYKKSPLLLNDAPYAPTQPDPSLTYFKMNSELATRLGFNNNEFPTQLNPDVLNYTLQDNIIIISDRPFFLKFNSDSYIIELLNLKINSMDAMSFQHRNFLAVIPNESNIVERVAYTAPVLLWIDLNNKERINLRQIKARVLDEGLNSIVCYGISQIVLLIQ